MLPFCPIKTVKISLNKFFIMIFLKVKIDVLLQIILLSNFMQCSSKIAELKKKW